MYAAALYYYILFRYIIRYVYRRNIAACAVAAGVYKNVFLLPKGLVCSTVLILRVENQNRVLLLLQVEPL